jgi:chromate transporter
VNDKTSVPLQEPAAVKPSRGALILELVAYFLRLGTLGFGGPVALCGLMEKDLVQDHGWLSKAEMRGGF